MPTTPPFSATPHDVKITCLVIMDLAIVATTLRLAERICMRRFGVDNWFAFLSMAMTIVWMVSLFIDFEDPPYLTKTTCIGLYYILAQFFSGIIWSAQLSILFSVIWICSKGRYKQMLLGLAGLFGVIFVILFAQVMWVCKSEPSWKVLVPFLYLFPLLMFVSEWNNLPPQCVLGCNVAIAQLITEIFADGCLIAAPIKLIWNIKTAKGEKYRLIAVFSTSIATSAVSLAHTYFILKFPRLDEALIAIVENGVSLIVCNLAVLVSVVICISRLRAAARTQSNIFGMKSSTLKFAGASSQTVDCGDVGQDDRISGSRKIVYEDESSFDQQKHRKWEWPQGPQVYVKKEQIVS